VSFNLRDVITPELAAFMAQRQVVDAASAEFVRLLRRKPVTAPNVEYRCEKGRCLLLAAYRKPAGIVCRQGAVRLSQSHLETLKWPGGRLGLSSPTASPKAVRFPARVFLADLDSRDGVPMVCAHVWGLLPMAVLLDHLRDAGGGQVQHTVGAS